MKQKFIFIFFILFSTNLFADISSGYFVYPNANLNEEISSQLGNKIKVALSKNGINSVEIFYPLVTVVKYDETDVQELDGMRKMVKVSGNITISVFFLASGNSLGSMEIEVTGSSDNKQKAARDAIKKITFENKEFKEFAEKVKKLYASSLDEFNKKCIAEAKKNKAKKEYEKALDFLAFVRDNGKAAEKKEADKLNAEIEKEFNRQSTRKEKLEDQERDRNYALTNKVVDGSIAIAKENQKTQQEEQRTQQEAYKTRQSREATNKAYYDAVSSYYSR